MDRKARNDPCGADRRKAAQFMDEGADWFEIYPP
jgi:hypothetical protein